MTQTHTVTLNRSIQASPKAVYRAFTTRGGLQEWLCDNSSVDARPGGRIFLWSAEGLQMMGNFTSLEENKVVAYTSFDPSPSHINVSLSGNNGKTDVTIEHAELQLDDAADVERYRGGWEHALENLQSVLEEGIDRRIYDRPMLGIIIGGLVDEGNRSLLQVPVDKGVVIADTVKGMGAAAVGLQKNDVLISMGEAETKDYYALQDAVRPHRAGDAVRIEWYRKSERHEAEMIFSGRPKPQIPATPPELAEEVRQIYERVDAELAEIFDGVEEELAEARPAEGEWNAKEVLGHLILTERAAQYWAVNVVRGRAFNNWASNDHKLVESVVAIHPTIFHLIAELRRTEGQTVDLLNRLPEEVLKHKGAFHNIVTMFNKNGLLLHTRMHFDQIKEALSDAGK